jgi:hypothetical protein
MPLRAHLALALVVLASSACATTSQQAEVIDTVTADGDERKKAFEATARVLDEHPEYVDELYAVTLQHPVAFNRFTDDTTRDLSRPPMAKLMATHLVQYDDSVEQVFIATLDAAKDKKEARAGIDRAIERRASLVADIMSDDPAAVLGVTEATVHHVARKPAARKAFLQAMQRKAPELAGILAQDPKTMAVLTGALLKEALKADPKALDDILEKAGVK